MRRSNAFHRSFFSLGITLITCLAFSSLPAIADDRVSTTEHPGKLLAFERSKGNCLACHVIEGGSLPGNVGPPLFNMQQRFPDRSYLRSQIWDARQNNPMTLMPPFGRHRILTEQEIDMLVDYLYTL